MGSPFSLFVLFLLFSIHFINTCSSLYMQSLCHEDESSTLMLFKRSIFINNTASANPLACLKIASWNPEETNDCCFWDGVECNRGTGHVIGLDLSNSCLFGSINLSSSLFRLVHLRRLNLAGNNFNYSQIPSDVKNLSRLTYLDLSFSVFYGQIPLEILKLSKLVSLNLSGNPLKFQNPGLGSLVENLTNLKELDLKGVNISSAVPHSLANMSSLTSLNLDNCRLHGEFPVGIFQLPHLQFLSVGLNQNLTGHLPEFHWSSPLQYLRLQATSFSGELPFSIGNLKSLHYLSIGVSNFSGLIPSSLGNLTKLTYLNLGSCNFSGQIPFSLANLTQLSFLSLYRNKFSSGTLYWLGKLTQLTILDLENTNLIGNIPSSLSNLTLLHTLILRQNQLTGKIPSWLANRTQLSALDLTNNNLHGPIPHWISTLQKLEYLDLADNNLSGTLEFDMFSKFKSLIRLELSGNQLSVLINPITNATLPNLKILDLGTCNLTEFPDFLRNQDEMDYLELGGNKIHGQVPKWMLNMGKHSLLYLGLEFNLLTGFDQPSAVLPWTNLRELHLDSNKLQGQVPIPPPYILVYSASNNTLSGEISPLFCNMTSLVSLDLSNNNLSGIIPQCLSNSSDSLTVLNLGNNKFHGNIPQTFTKGNSLTVIDLSQNQLRGRLPRSLANCAMLGALNLGNNLIKDVFPSWLDVLPELRVLILRSNGLHGAIRKPKTTFVFPKLCIIDLSHNNFTGKLPFEYFQSWNAMKTSSADQLTYMQVSTSFTIANYRSNNAFSFTMTMKNKGRDTEYMRIQEVFVAIDLSSNKFEGEIPEVIGYLFGLHMLDLSNNMFTGSIPSSLGNLTLLESLDLSQNKLYGEIPQELTDLNFLEFLNVSHNSLTGAIPQGTQLDTFENSSFEGNPGLCGNPLSKKCKNPEMSLPTPSSFEQVEDSEFPTKYDWIFIAMGYGSGLVVGWLIGHIVTSTKWFAKIFRRMQRRWRR